MIASTRIEPEADEDVSPNSHPIDIVWHLRKGRQILHHYRKGCLAVFAGIMGTVALATLVVPKTYQSEAKLFVRVGRESVSLDPTATTGQTISVYESRENEINSVVDVLQSRVIVEEIVRVLGPELMETNGSNNQAEPLTKYEFDSLARRLSNTIMVTHTKKSNVITITSKERSPELAQKVLQAMLTAFREQHLRINRTAGSYNFFRDQRNHLEKELEEARAKLRDTKNEYGIVSVEGQRKILEQKIQDIETALLLNQRAVGASQAEIEAIERLQQEIPKTILSQHMTGFFNDAEEQTRQQLHQLEMSYNHLRTKFTDRQPEVRAVKEKIQAAQAILEQSKDRNSQQTETVNPSYQQIEIRRVTESARIQSLEAEHKLLQAQREALEHSLQKLNSQELELARLEHQVTLRESTYKVYEEKLEQARIDQALEAENISNVNVVQPATFLPQAVSPKRRVIMGLGLLFGAISAVGYGFARNYLSEQETEP